VNCDEVAGLGGRRTFGHYGLLSSVWAWHSAGTYRMGDGAVAQAAGNQRFPPLKQLGPTM